MGEERSDDRQADPLSLEELFPLDEQAAAVFAAGYTRTFEELYAMILAQGVSILDEDPEVKAELVGQAEQELGLEGDVASAAYVALVAGIFEYAERTGLDPVKLGAGVRRALERVEPAVIQELDQTFEKQLEEDRTLGALPPWERSARAVDDEEPPE